jgi:hypothetical protein
MRPIRPRSVYDVLALISFLLVVGGGTAIASFVISSNGQVGPRTISGHAPPKGDHANLIPGSISGKDVADDSLGGPQILERSLAGNVRKLVYEANSSSATTGTSIGKIGPFALKATCLDLGSGITRFTLFARGPAGTAHYTYQEVADNNPDGYQKFTFKDVPIPANTDTEIARTGDIQDHYTGIAGTAILRTGPTIVEINFTAQANSPYLQKTPPHCFLYGTASRAI